MNSDHQKKNSASNLSRFIITASCLALSLAGCGGSGGQVASTNQAPTSGQYGGFRTLSTGAPGPAAISVSSSATVFGLAGTSFTKISSSSTGTTQAINKIVFIQGTEIWTCNPDGSNPVQLTSDGLAKRYPSYSFDASHIAYGSPTGIWLMNADGSDLKEIVTSGGNTVYSYPRFSPDGTRITFSSYANASDTIIHVYVVNIDGTHLTDISVGSPYVFEDGPSWSSTGKIVFQVKLSSGIYNLAERNPDGSGLVQLDNITSNQVDPEWSADGTKIAYSDENSIYSCSATGTNIKKISSSTSAESNPCWSADGTKLVFDNISASGTVHHLYTCNADGTGFTDITPNATVQCYDPFWSQSNSTSITNTVLVGAGSTSGLTGAAGFFYSQIGLTAPFFVAWDTADSSTAGRMASTVTAVTPLNTNGQNLIFQISANKATSTSSGLLSVLKFANGTSPFQSISLSTSTAAFVSFDAGTGYFSSAVAYAKTANTRFSADGSKIFISAQFEKVIDADGKNIAPQGASEVVLDRLSGAVINWK